MKTQQELLKMTFSLLSELQSGTVEPSTILYIRLQTELALLYNILGETIPDE